MPEYRYRCPYCGFETLVVEPMLAVTATYCPNDNTVLRRRPWALAVNWGGLKPSSGELSPEIKHLLATTDQRRDYTESKYGGRQNG